MQNQHLHSGTTETNNHSVTLSTIYEGFGLLSYQLCSFLAGEGDLGGVVGGGVRRADGCAAEGDLHLVGVAVIARRGGDSSDVLHRKEKTHKPTMNLKTKIRFKL